MPRPASGNFFWNPFICICAVTYSCVALSGGIDSSATTCVVRHLHPDADLHTFSFIAAGSDVSEEHWATLGQKRHEPFATLLPSSRRNYPVTWIPCSEYKANRSDPPPSTRNTVSFGWPRNAASQSRWMGRARTSCWLATKAIQDRGWLASYAPATC